MKRMKIVWFAPEITKYSSGLINHNQIFIDYLHNHPDVEELVVVKYPLPEHGVMPPLYENINGIRFYTPRISIDYHDAFKSILQVDLKFSERLKVHLFKLALKFKGIKRFESEKIKKWGLIEFGLLGISSVQMPFPNPFQEEVGRCIVKLHPDIVQSHTEMCSIIGGLAKSVVKGHFSYQVLVEEEKESMPRGTISRTFWERSEDALQWSREHNAVDIYIAASEFVEKRLQERGMNPEQIKVIHSPIILKYLTPLSKSEAKSRLGIPQNKRIILSVGRFLERKRFIDLIPILKTLPDDVILYIKRSISTSDDLFPSAINQFQKEIRKHKLEKRVIINSEVLPYEKMHEIYSAADLAVFPFLYEPFGLCAAESMALGSPVIVYNSGFLPKFIDGNGFIVEPMNFEDLREKIHLLLNDPVLAAEMGAKGPALVKQYDISVLGEKLLDIYREYL